jgi:hypothetical protein
MKPVRKQEPHVERLRKKHHQKRKQKLKSQLRAQRSNYNHYLKANPLATAYHYSKTQDFLKLENTVNKKAQK